MKPIIRDELPGDEAAIAEVTTAAFKTIAEASGTEAKIIDRLRAAGALTLSLVAERNGEIVGHATFSPAMLDGKAGWFGLGPISVRPDLHKKGIGSALMREGLDRLRRFGAAGCLVVGHPAYYPRFGFRSRDGLICPGVPPEATMAIAFGAETPEGEMSFHPAFVGEL